MKLFNCDQLREILGNGATVLDVRSYEEFNRNALPQACNIPLPLLPVLANERLNKENEILVYCEVGGRAHMAQQILNSLGFNRVTNIGGVHHYSSCC
jgi:rhodanese-related sulfurtransferase